MKGRAMLTQLGTYASGTVAVDPNGLSIYNVMARDVEIGTSARFVAVGDIEVVDGGLHLKAGARGGADGMGYSGSGRVL